MADGIGLGESTSLAADEAFAILGNETRLQILHTLGEEDAPLAFSELYDRLDYEPATNFSYHLQKLEGHFIHKVDEGYELGQPGTRVVQAILSGVVTEAPRIERTEVDHHCEFCGGSTEISYAQGILGLYCTDCSSEITESWPPEFRGFIRGYPFPPAGLQGRTAREIYRAAFTRGLFQEMLIASEICPTCSAPLDHSINICDDHQAEEDFCEACGRRWAVMIIGRCTNCIIEGGIRLRTYVLTETEVMAFLSHHGINPLAPATEPWIALETDEEICSTEPITAQVTFTSDDDAITVTVDEDLSVRETTRHPASKGR